MKVLLGLCVGVFLYWIMFKVGYASDYISFLSGGATGMIVLSIIKI
jgi:hypothetical protein